MEAETNKLRLKRFGISEEDYAFRYQNEIIHQYSYLHDTIKIIPDYSADGWTAYFRYSYFHIFAAIGSLIIVCSCIVHDRTIGMWNISRTTKRGRGVIYGGKCCSVFVLSFVYAIICQLIVLIAAWKIFGLSDSFADIQNLPMFVLSTFRGSVFSFFFFTLIQRSFIIAVLALITATVAAISGRYSATIIFGISTYGVCYLLYSISITSSWRFLNFFESLYSASFFSRYEAINICGYPISILFICGVFSIFQLVTAVPVIFIGLAEPLKRNIRKPRLDFGKNRIEYPTLRPNNTLSLVQHELNKVFSPSLSIALLLIFIFHLLISINHYHHNKGSQEQILQEYITLISEWDEEQQLAFIENELERIGSIVNAEAEMTTQYFNGKITADEFSNYNRSLHAASIKIQPLISIQERLAYLHEISVNKDIKGQLMFDYSTEKLISGVNPICLYISIVLIACSIGRDYAQKEGDTNFKSILSTTKQGRSKTLTVKLTILCFAVTLLVLVFTGVEILLNCCILGIPKFSVLLISLPDFSSTDSEITIGLWYILEVVIKILISFFGAFLCYGIMFFVQNTLYYYLIVLTTALIPRLLSNMGISILHYFDPVMLLTRSELYQISAKLSYWDYGLVIGYIMLLCIIIVNIWKKMVWRCEYNM